jgi:tetratricopeptide (TPR) repeat protein
LNTPTHRTQRTLFRKTIQWFAILHCAFAAALRAQVHSEPIAGDREFAAMNYPAAIAAYDSLLRSSSVTDSSGILWRLARVHICLGDVMEGDSSRHHYHTAETFARRSMQLDSASSEVRTWYAAAIGSVALHEGAKAKVRTAWEIKRQVDCAIALNPENDIAYSILGSFHRSLGGVSWIERSLASLFVAKLPEGSFEEGEKALRRAIELNPRTPRYYYELGLLYLDWDKKRFAKEVLTRSVALPFVTARDKQNKTDAERRLAALNDE